MPSRHSFQFSLLGLFGAMTLVAVFCAVFFAAPLWVGLLAALFFGVSIPGVLTTMLVYGRGYGRTFAIGALFPVGLAALPVALYSIYWPAVFLGSGVGDDPDTRRFILIYVVGGSAMAAGSGLTAVATRWLIERPRRRREAAGREARLRATKE